MHLNKPYNTAKLPRISLGYFVLFLIWPFAVFVHSLRQFRAPQSKTVFWLFCVFFGLVFIVAEEKLGAADSARYFKELKELHQGTYSFSDLLDLIYSEGGYVDVYQPVLTWLVASFTDNPKVLFALYAAIFGFFYVQNLWMVLSRIQIRISFLLLLFMLALALTNPIWNINGVRMWTAAHIFLYGVLKIYLNQDKKGYIWVMTSAFVHFSFIFPVILLLIYSYIPKIPLVYFIFYVTASFVNEINYEGLRDALEFLPEIFKHRARSYVNEQYVVQVQESYDKLNWHIRFADYAQNFVLYIWNFVSFAFYKKWSRYLPNVRNLYLFGLFSGGFANIAVLVPSGGRFLVISNFVFWVIFIILLAEFSMFRYKIKWLKQITFIPLVFYILISLRRGMDFFGLLLFLGNPIFAFFIDDQIPLIEFVKSLI